MNPRPRRYGGERLDGCPVSAERRGGASRFEGAPQAKGGLTRGTAEAEPRGYSGNGNGEDPGPEPRQRPSVC